MKISRLVFMGKILTSAIILLGVIHNIATFTPLINGGLSCLPPDSYRAILYFSLLCGTSFILSGVLLILMLRKVEQHPFLTTFMLIIGVFLALGGVLAVVYMLENPFAWIAFVLNLGIFLVILGLHLRLRNAARIQ